MRGISAILGGLVVLASAARAPAQEMCPGDRLLKLLASDGSSSDFFGQSVAIDGDTAIVGARSADGISSGTGAAYIYERDGLFWNEVIKLTASDGSGNDSFGQSVAIDGDTILVGAYRDDDRGTDAGSAYIFENIGGVWTQTAKLLAPDGQADDWFGYSVAISGETAIVGAYRDDDLGSDAGSAYVFEKINGTWTQTAKLLAPDGQAGDVFGWSVAIDGGTILVGAFLDDDRGTDAGAVYVFQRLAGSWFFIDKLTASDGQANDAFGLSVAIDGDSAIIGAQSADRITFSTGAAYIFERVGNTWIQAAKLTAPDGGSSDLFGKSVAIDGDTAIVGAYRDDDRGDRSGSAYIFEKVNGNWTQTAKILAFDGQEIDVFGWSVAISAGTSIVGAFGDDDLGSEAGSAYIVPWTRPNDCCPDIDRSGVLDASDFFVFLDLFAADDLRADFNGDRGIDASDFFIYLDEFAAGCP